MLFFQQKVSPLFVFFFLSLALALSRTFPRWASLACRLLSPFLCLSLSLFSKFVAVTINLSSILWQHGCRNNFRFRLYWLFSCLCFPRRGWSRAISSQNNLELHLGCHKCWLSYFTFSVILRPWVMVQPWESNPRPIAGLHVMPQHPNTCIGGQEEKCLSPLRTKKILLIANMTTLSHDFKPRIRTSA